MPQSLTISPDLQTRESIMVAAGRVQLALTHDDGLTSYVKIECKAKDLPGSSKRYTAVPLEDATHVFISEQGYGTQKIGSYYPPKAGSRYTEGRLFTDLHGRPVEAVLAAVHFINTGQLLAPFASIEAESQCGLCGRKLTDPVSIKRGIGPECAGKPTGTKILRASKFAQAELEDALEKCTGAVKVTVTEEKAQGGHLPPTHLPMVDWKQATDAELDSHLAAIQREQEKRAFAKREAEQERKAHAQEVIPY